MRAVYALLVLLALFICGCQGSSSHDVSTGLNGSLDGLALTPAGQELGIGTSSNFYLDWQSGSEPPSVFHVTMVSVGRDNTQTGVPSTLHTISTGHYRLEPDVLDTQTFYLLSVTGNGQEVRAIYLTSGSAMTRREGAAGQVEHTVNTR